MTFEEIYQIRCQGKDRWPDIHQHIPTLRKYASQVQHITEFGVRSGNSTVGFMAGLSDRGSGTLIGYDIAPFQPELSSVPVPKNITWEFRMADTSKLDRIDQTDILFIDSFHERHHVTRELSHHAAVSSYIIMHDTMEWGKTGDGPGAEGITPSIMDFLAQQWKNWRVYEHFSNNMGLLVMKRW